MFVLLATQIYHIPFLLGAFTYFRTSSLEYLFLSFCPLGLSFFSAPSFSIYTLFVFFTFLRKLRVKCRYTTCRKYRYRSPLSHIAFYFPFLSASLFLYFSHFFLFYLFSFSFSLLLSKKGKGDFLIFEGNLTCQLLANKHQDTAVENKSGPMSIQEELANTANSHNSVRTYCLAY